MDEELAKKPNGEILIICLTGEEQECLDRLLDKIRSQTNKSPGEDQI